MSADLTPKTVLQNLAVLFESTGIHLLHVAGALPFLENDEGPAFEQWSTYFNRLYRYHDFCALELSELTAEGGKGAEHILVEMKKHEALSGAYRMADMAIVAANPTNEKGLPNPVVIEDELGAIKGSLLIIFWAFATKSQRQNFTDSFEHSLESGDIAALMKASPNECLDPMGETGTLLEDLAEEMPIQPNFFKQKFYPPLHPAVEMDRIYTDEEMALLKLFIDH